VKTLEAVHELFLNYACNAKCPFCYNPPLTPALLKNDLSFRQAAESLYAGASAGAKILNIHGGEVTLRDDLPKILALAKKLEFKQITVVTNGIRLAQAAYVRKLVAAGATHFRISIHAPDAAIHDKILAIPGAFEKAVRAVKNLQAAGVPVGLNFVMNRANYMTLPRFVERFADAGDIIVYFPHLRGMAQLNARSVALRYADAAAYVRTALKGAQNVLLANFPPCAAPELTDKMLDWRKDEGEPSSMIHPEGFTESLGEMKDGQRTLIPACARCRHKGVCRGIEAEYLQRFGKDEFKAVR
jgi:MoaA/NifB/PqqE/SkfB family radical SAM enzyme